MKKQEKCDNVQRSFLYNYVQWVFVREWNGNAKIWATFDCSLFVSIKNNENTVRLVSSSCTRGPLGNKKIMNVVDGLGCTTTVNHSCTARLACEALWNQPFCFALWQRANLTTRYAGKFYSRTLLLFHSTRTSRFDASFLCISQCSSEWSVAF